LAQTTTLKVAVFMADHREAPADAPQINRELRRGAAIGPVIGYLKASCWRRHERRAQGLKTENFTDDDIRHRGRVMDATKRVLTSPQIEIIMQGRSVAAGLIRFDMSRASA
jgi:hypothetical protein